MIAPGGRPVRERGSGDRSFPDRLAGLVVARRSQVVVGLDPDPSRLWPARDAAEGAPPGRGEELPAAASAGDAAALTGRAVADHCLAVIDAVAPSCVAVKLQLACFERLGAPGWEALTAVTAAARAHDLLVIADGKRGDVPVTARAYAASLVGETAGPYGPVAGLGADAFTANPLLGRDALEPLVAAADDAGAGCFVLVRTSNRGARDLQDLPAPERPLHEHLARMTDELGSRLIGESGLSAIGAVTGATAPGLLARLRELMPRTIFLLPGIGAQGGTVNELTPAFAPHPAAGLVTAARSIVDAHVEQGGAPAVAAAAAAAELRRTVWALSASE